MVNSFLNPDVPNPPDYGEVIGLSKEQAEKSYELSQQQFQWAQDQWMNQKDTLESIISSSLPHMQDQWNFAKEDRARYEELYQPLEDQFLDRASRWDTTERREQEAAKAQTEVATQFEAQRQNALQRLEGYGVDPSQTRSQALDLGVRIEEAKAMATGANNARTRVENEGMELLGNTIQQGRGLAAQGTQYGAAANTTAAVTGNASSAWQGANESMGTPLQWGAHGNNALGNTANAKTQQFEGDISQHNAEQAPMNSLIQAGATAAGLAGFAEGGEVQALPSPPGEGGEMRGPGGPKDDAIPARISDGEYVIPTDVVRRKGTEFFDKLIAKTQEDLAAREDTAQVTQHALALPPPQLGAAPGGMQ